MASDVRIGVRTDTGTSDQQIKGLRGHLQALGQSAKSSILTGVGLGAGVGAFNLLGAAVEGATRYVIGSIDAGSHLNETISKTGQIFGQEAIPALEDWAESAAEAFGQSKQQALDAASTFAIFGKSAGKSGEELIDFSTDLTELASDFASFFDTSPEEAITAIGAALRGESEPIRRYGVLLNDATLKARALKDGIIETTTQALTPQQRVLAAQAEIFAQSADAQGDFQRTQGGFANTTRELQAKLTNLSAEIGEKLLPVVVGLAEGFLIVVDAIDKLIGSVGRLIDYWNPFITTTEEVTDKFNASWGEIPGIAKMQLDATTDVVSHGVADIVNTTITGAEAAATGGAEAIGELPQKSADAILENQFHYNDAIDQLREYAENALTPKQERLRAKAFLTSHWYADALASGNPYLIQKAEELAAHAYEVLGRRTPAYDAGLAFVRALASGIERNIWITNAAAAKIADGMMSYFPQSEPKNPASALRGITTLGRRMVKMIGDDMQRASGSLRGPMVNLTGAMAGGGRMAVAAGGGGGGITINLPPTTIPYSPAQYREAVQTLTPELVRELRRQGYAF